MNEKMTVKMTYEAFLRQFAPVWYEL